MLSLHFFRLTPPCGTVKGQGRPFGSALHHTVRGSSQDGPSIFAQDVEREPKREPVERRKSNREPVERQTRPYENSFLSDSAQCLQGMPRALSR